MGYYSSGWVRLSFDRPAEELRDLSPNKFWDETGWGLDSLSYSSDGREIEGYFSEATFSSKQEEGLHRFAIKHGAESLTLFRRGDDGEEYEHWKKRLLPDGSWSTVFEFVQWELEKGGLADTLARAGDSITDEDRVGLEFILGKYRRGG